MVFTIALLIECIGLLSDILIWISSKLKAENVIAILTLVAIALGPYVTFRISQNSDKAREQERRRWQIFRSLMRNREERLSPEFVGALNLIEVEFHNHYSVIEAWRRYRDHMAVGLEAEYTEKHYQEMDKLREELFLEIARTFNVEVDRRDIEDGYSPIGWEDKEKEEQHEKNLTLSILEGTRPLSVKIEDGSKESYINIQSSGEIDMSNNENKGIHRRFSDEWKLSLISRIMRGEKIISVARDAKVSVYELRRWHDIVVTELKRVLRQTRKSRRIDE